MTANEFCYWLQGRAELLPDQPPSEAEWKMIREHLALVFTKVTPAKAPQYAPTPLELIGQRPNPQPVPMPMYPSPGWDRAQCVTPAQVLC